MQTLGGYFQIYFTEKTPVDYRTACIANKTMFLKLQEAIVNEGIYFWPNYMFPHGISASHNKDDLQKILKALEIGLSKIVG